MATTPHSGPGSVSGSSVSSSQSGSEGLEDMDFMLKQHVKLDNLQERLHKANELLATKEAECDTLTEQIDQRNREYDELMKERDDLNAELLDKEGEYDELKEKLNEMTKEKDRIQVDHELNLNDVLVELEGMTAAKEKELKKKKRAEREVQQFEAELETAKREAKTQKDELEKAKQEAKRQKETAKREIAANGQLRAAVHGLRKENSDLMKMAEEKAREEDEVTAQKIKKAVEKCETHWKGLAAKADDTRRKHLTTFLEMKKKLEKTTADLNTAQKSEQHLRERLSSVWGEMRDRQVRQANASEREVGRLKEELDDLKKKIGASKEEEVKKANEITTLSDEKERLAAKLSMSQKSEKDLKKCLLAIAGEKDRLVRDRNEREREVGLLKEELNDLKKNRIKKLTTNLTMSQKSERDLKERMQAIAGEKERLVRERNEREREVGELKEELNDLEETNSDLEKKVESANARKNVWKNKAKKSAAEIEKLTADLTLAQNENDPLEYEATAAEEAADEEQLQQRMEAVPFAPVADAFSKQLFDAAQNQKQLQTMDQMRGMMKEKDRNLKLERRRYTALLKTVCELKAQLNLKQLQGQGRGEMTASTSAGKRPAEGQGQARVQGRIESEGVAHRFEPARKKKKCGLQYLGLGTSYGKDRELVRGGHI